MAGVAALAASALAIAHAPTLPVVLAADVAMAVLGAVFAPTVAAITVGLTLRHDLAARLGRNAACDRAGNIFIALLAGLVGWMFSQRAVFHLVPFFAVLTAAVVLTIPATAIDHERARGLDGERGAPGQQRPAGWRVLLRCRPLLVLAAAAFGQEPVEHELKGDGVTGLGELDGLAGDRLRLALEQRLGRQTAPRTNTRPAAAIPPGKLGQPRRY